jgi:hypothetical protein
MRLKEAAIEPLRRLIRRGEGMQSQDIGNCRGGGGGLEGRSRGERGKTCPVVCESVFPFREPCCERRKEKSN